jgi:hypothetical protein
VKRSKVAEGFGVPCVRGLDAIGFSVDGSSNGGQGSDAPSWCPREKVSETQEGVAKGKAEAPIQFRTLEN